MYYTQTNEQLHRFTLPPEAEALDILAEAEAAQAHFAPGVIDTDLALSSELSYGTSQVYVKRTDRLPGDSFKYLSATNSVAQAQRNGGGAFVFPTAGSYGKAVGIAVDQFGGNGTGVVPVDTNPTIVGSMREHGLKVIEAGANFDESAAIASRYAEEQGITLMHPFASVANVAATALLACQVAEQEPAVTDVVLQFGGGSLTSGVTAALKLLLPNVRTHLVQVAGCSPVVDSMRSGSVCESRDPFLAKKSWHKSLGGVGVGKTHPFTLGLASQYVDHVATISSEDVYATRYDFGQVDGKTPSFAAAVGLSQARILARALYKRREVAFDAGIELPAAKIVAFHTGGQADDYLPGYLAAMSERVKNR